jgi:hypothetical protein
MIMDTVANGSGRDASGRFVPGQSGNPAGKVPGTRNRKTVLMAALRDGEGEAAARVVIEKALAGDAVAARFVVALISPKPRGRTIHLDMPEDDDCNVVTAFNVTLRALCDGEITPDEAVTVSRFLDGRRRVLQAWQLEEKLTSYGRVIPGDPEWAQEADEDEDEDDDAQMDGDDDDVLLMHPELPAQSEAAAPPAESEAAASSVTLEPTSPPPATSGAPAGLPPLAAASVPEQPQSEEAALQTACISLAPESVPGFLSVPADGFDAALAASVARRLRAATFVR